VPTTAEGGLTGFEVATWYAMWAPKGTPADIVERARTELARALTTQAIRDAWARNGSDIPTMPVAEFPAFLTAEIARWGRVVRDANVAI
jgi:tripartite-type tricarboxylate transporter receptor subunit TctC